MTYGEFKYLQFLANDGGNTGVTALQMKACKTAGWVKDEVITPEGRNAYTQALQNPPGYPRAGRPIPQAG
jgi:hypothetical protein